MATPKVRWLAAGAAAVAAAAGLTTWLVTNTAAPPSPVVNPAQARAMLPAVNAYLSSHAAQLTEGAYLAGAYPGLKTEDFCAARIIEIRPAGHQWRVGMAVTCGEFARRDLSLLEGTAGEDNDVMTLAYTQGHYRAESLVTGPIYYDPAWVTGHFSPGAAAEVDSATPPAAPYPVQQARHAFGLAAASRIVRP
jgi:hypothetical protein